MAFWAMYLSLSWILGGAFAALAYQVIDEVQRNGDKQQNGSERDSNHVQRNKYDKRHGGYQDRFGGFVSMFWACSSSKSMGARRSMISSSSVAYCLARSRTFS